MSFPVLRLAGGWESAFEGEQRSRIAALVPAHLGTRRWFGGKARTQRGVTIADAIPIRTAAGMAFFTLIHVGYLENEPDTYAFPLACATGAEAVRLESEAPELILARVECAKDHGDGVIYDATGSRDFADALLEAIVTHRTFEGKESRIECSAMSALEELDISPGTRLIPRLSAVEQSNTAVRFGDRFLLKLFRRPGEGANPDLEIGRILTARGFKNAPPLLGAIEYHARAGEYRVLGVLHGFVSGSIDGWDFTLQALRDYYGRVRDAGGAHADGEPEVPQFGGAVREFDAQVTALLGGYAEAARKLGQRTAELHLALASVRGCPGFVPEPFTADYQRGLCEALCNLAIQNLTLLESRIETLEGEARELAVAVVAAEAPIIQRFDRLRGVSLTGRRIRVHGDYHLGQTLYAGGDFFIVDFEGEPSVPLAERRRKWTPFRDVAGMLRSFDYAANAALRGEIEEGGIPTGDLARFTAWAGRWTRCVSATYLESYLSQPGIAGILPVGAAERALVLETFLLGKAVYELGYEVNNRPAWLPIPCRGILALLRRG